MPIEPLANEPPPEVDELLAQQMAFQRLDWGADFFDDKTVRDNLRAAADWIERDTNRAVFAGARTKRLPHRCGHLGHGGHHEHQGARSITLWPTPLLEVVAITYLDPAGTLQPLDPADYEAVTDEEPGRVEFRNGFNWPATSDVARPVTITYRSGYADVALIPPSLLAAVRILASHLYENREAATVVQLHEVPMGVQRLLDLHRFVRLEGE